MKSYRMSVYATEDVASDKILSFLHNLYTISDSSFKIGLIEKFTNALGYSDVDWHVASNFSYQSSKIENPSSYVTPNSYIHTHLYNLNTKNELFTILFDVVDYIHTDSRYNYNTFDIMMKLQNFLYKVYGNYIRIEFREVKSVKLELKDWLFSHFLFVVAQGEHYDTECAVDRLLKKKEREYILRNIRKYVSYEPGILQYYCDTCAGYDITRPFHTELVDNEWLKRNEQEIILGDKFNYFND